MLETTPALDAGHWQVLSRLFDEALDLPAEARPPWLAELAVGNADLAARLRRMLATELAAELATDLAATTTPAPFDRLLQAALQHEAPVAPDAPLADRRLGAWQLLRQIGEGGMGQVWLARRADGLYEQDVAIKLLRSDLQQAPLSARFARERTVLARLNHPGIAKLLDAGVDGGMPFLVLEHVAGRTLSAHVDAACPTVAERVALLLRVALAVQHAHTQLVVHRDLKPSNVMVGEDGEPKVLDFGIAGLLDDETPGQLTRMAGRGLTLAYAAPEQLGGEAIGVAADVYALGVLLYEMLAGSLPFGAVAGGRAAQELALLHQDAPRLSQLAAAGPAEQALRPTDFARVRGDLEAIVAKALRKQPAERYASVAELMADLRRWQAHRPVAARRDELRHRVALWLRRHALAAGLSGGLALAVSAGLVISFMQWQRAEAAARQSDQVTRYLTELLASAHPDRHGGESPRVLDLLDRSRRQLGDKFKDEPATQARLLEVLSKTYEGLSRYDLAGPLAEQWAALTSQAHGEDDLRSIQARLKVAQIYTPNGPWDGVIAQLEPLRPRIAARLGPRSETMRELLYTLANAQTKTGQLDAAAATLKQAGALTDALYPPGSFERAFHRNFESVRLAAGGQVGAALAELRQTETAQAQASTDNLRHALALRRNTWALQIRLGDYEQIEARDQSLAADMDRLHGAGSATRAFLHPEMARYHGDRAEFAKAVVEREAFLAGNNGSPRQAQGASRAALLLARALAQSAPVPTLLAEAQALLAEVAQEAGQLGALRRAEAWLALARSGLLLNDQALAAAAIERLRQDPELHLDADHWLDSRVAQVEGELRRAQGDWAGSRRLLAQRVALLASSPDARLPAIWQARLDLATTLTLMRDPDAPRELALAAAARPPKMPAAHPLDAVQAYLVALQQQRDQPDAQAEAQPVRLARQALARAYQRAPAALPPGLGGLF